MHPAFPPDPAPLEIDRVEWVPATADVVHVHLLGRWRDRPAPQTLVLLVRSGERSHAFEALAEPPGGVLAAFAVPNELRARLTAEIALRVGARELALPGARTGSLREGPAREPPEGEVVDRAVLAERRARRAELAEESLQRRAAEAEQALATVEAQLANLEERLGQARGERDELEARLADAERRLEEVQQRESAEQRERLAAQDRVEQGRRESARAITDLRRRLMAATGRAEDVARSLVEVAALAEELRAALAAEQAARARAEAALAAEREGAAASLALLEHELRSRAEAQDRLAEQLREVGAAIEVERRGFAEQVTAIEQRVRGLREQVAQAVAAVSALRARDDARETAVRRRVAELLGTAASVRDAYEEESRDLRAELTQVLAEERRRMSEELGSMRTRTAEGAGETPEAQAVLGDLARAAQRLREATPPAPADEAAPAETVALEPHGGGSPSAGPWLATAIRRLADGDPVAAGRLVVGLLPVQRVRVAGEATYEITVHELGTFRVALRGGAASVERRAEAGPRREIDFHLAGPAAAFAGLAAGGIRRRPPEVRLEGSRRKLRRLLKGLRSPVGLREVARAGAAVEPGLVLRALVAAMDPAWTAGHAFAVGWEVAGPGGGAWTVRAGDGSPTVGDGLPEDGTTATVRVSQEGFAALVAGLEPTPGPEPAVTGSADAVALLHRWFERAQGLPAA